MLTFDRPCAALIPRQTEAGARAWIDAFFFRATAMLSSDKRMVLTMEYAVPSVNIGPSNINISGLIDYAAIVANKKNASKSTVEFSIAQPHHFP
jgi:hypothetical protein